MKRIGWNAILGLGDLRIRGSKDQGATLLLGPSPHSQTSLYESVSYINTPENTFLASTFLDRLTPPPEFA